MLSNQAKPTLTNLTYINPPMFQGIALHLATKAYAMLTLPGTQSYPGGSASTHGVPATRSPTNGG